MRIKKDSEAAVPPGFALNQAHVSHTGGATASAP